MGTLSRSSVVEFQISLQFHWQLDTQQLHLYHTRSSTDSRKSLLSVSKPTLTSHKLLLSKNTWLIQANLPSLLHQLLMLLQLRPKKKPRKKNPKKNLTMIWDSVYSIRNISIRLL